jgi:PKD repeat protein
MRTLLRPLFVGALSIAIAATSLLASSSVALGATPSITSLSLSGPVYPGDRPFLNGTFTDPDAGDQHTVDIDWGDGNFDSYTLPVGDRSFSLQKSVPYGNDTAGAELLLQVTVADGISANTKYLSIVVQQLNQAPSITSFGVTAGSEGGSSTLALTFADVDVLDTHTVSVAWGDGSTSGPTDLAAGVTTFEASHVYADTGTYSVVLTLADSAGHTVTANASVSPANVAPVVGSLSLSPSSVVDHETLTVSGTFTDPGTADTFTLTVEWGDGTSSTDSLAAGTRSFSATHAYAAAGPVTITATVTDRDSGRSSSSAELVVLSSNHAPANLSLAMSGTGANVVVDATFTDPDLPDTHEVLVSWGDGASAAQSLAAGTTTFTASHVYEASGTYTVGATVTDPAGTSTSATTQVVVTVPTQTASEVLDEMSGLVLSFGLDRNTERWLLKKIDDLKDSLTTGNSQVCSDSGTLTHVMTFAQRELTSNQYAALNALATELKAAAGCADPTIRPNGQPKKTAARARSSAVQ